MVHVPWGAYPTACYRCYDYDSTYLNAYRAQAPTTTVGAYLERFVYGSANHEALLERVGRERLERLRADARTGYAITGQAIGGRP